MELGDQAQVGMHTHMFLLGQLTGSRSDDTPVATGLPGTQIWVSNLIPQNKETGLLGEMIDSKTEAENIPDEPESRKVLQTKQPQPKNHRDGSVSRGHRRLPKERPPTAKARAV